MILCINPSCPQPVNDDSSLLCQACGWQLLLGQRYQIIRQLGSGGLVMTYQASDRGMAKVIKILTSNHPTALQWFSEQIRVFRQINHPGLPKIDKFFTFQPIDRPKPWHCLVMEYIDGKNLSQYITNTSIPIEQSTVLDWLNQLMRILAELHQHRFLHRNIKPSNIILKHDGQLVLIDFYTTRTSSGSSPRQVTSELIPYSAFSSYISLEQLQFQAVPQSDFFALARTFVYLITAKEPETLYNAFTREFNWRQYAPQISPLIADLLDEMMADVPTQRPASAKEILGRLREIDAALHPRLLRPQINNTLPGHSQWITSLAIYESGKFLVSGCWDKTIKVWHLQNGSLIGTLTGHTDGVLAVAISPVSSILVSGSWDRTLKVWQLKNGRLIGTLTGHSDAVLAIAISPDGKTLVSGSGDKSLKIWHLKTGKLIRTLIGHNSWVRSIAISRDGKIMASASYDKTINIWDFHSDRLLYHLIGHTAPVTSVAISPDGQTVVSGSFDNSINIWNLKNGQLLGSLFGHSNTVTSVAINPDGQTLVSGSDDKTVRIWDLDTGEMLSTLPGHSAQVTCVTISPDGQTLVSGSYDNTIKVWRLR